MFFSKNTVLKIYLKISIVSISLLMASFSNANECLDLLPYDTVANGHSKICQSSFNGMNNHYSCQDYQSGDTRYRVLYRGGVTPKAIIKINPDNSEQLLSAPLFGDLRLRCPLTPPAGIPEYAVHRGTGVCQDENDSMVACSVFEHAAARKMEATRYMTFFASEKPSVVIDAQIASDNEDAMVAEIAFQIGMSLWDTDCCSERAVEYLEQAYKLFPQAEPYRTAYRRTRAIIAMEKLSYLDSYRY